MFRVGIYRFCEKYYALIVVSIILAALAIGIEYIFMKDEYLLTDSISYIDMAFGILTNDPVSYFPNGYLLIISLIVTIFGENNFIAILLILKAYLFSALFKQLYLRFG